MFMCLCVYVFMCSCVHVFMCLCVYVFMCLYVICYMLYIYIFQGFFKLGTMHLSIKEYQEGCAALKNGVNLKCDDSTKCECLVELLKARVKIGMIQLLTNMYFFVSMFLYLSTHTHSTTPPPFRQS